ncbi:MAG: hypothetical protein ACOC1F_06720, partial [Myxococcota bacterium]
RPPNSRLPSETRSVFLPAQLIDLGYDVGDAPAIEAALQEDRATGGVGRSLAVRCHGEHRCGGAEHAA